MRRNHYLLLKGSLVCCTIVHRTASQQMTVDVISSVKDDPLTTYLHPSSARWKHFALHMLLAISYIWGQSMISHQALPDIEEWE